MRTFFGIIILLFFSGSVFSQSFSKFQFNGLAQGSTYHITYYAPDSLVTKAQVDSMLNKIDSSLSLYKPYSLINRFNTSTTGLAVDEHFARVVKKAQEVYQKTGGLFDITVFPLTQAWGFGPAKKNSMPGPATIRRLLSCVGSDKLYFKDKALFKKTPCVQLDANGIAQGYSVDIIAGFFEQQGIGHYLVELGGEIRVKGRKQPGNERMKIGIESPDSDEFGTSMMQKIIEPDEGAITTSGNYRRYYESKGKKITHLINPKTGYTLQNELISVVVYAQDAITADAYDNALMLMGLKKALVFVEAHPEIAAYFIYRKANGKVAATASNRFRKLLK